MDWEKCTTCKLWLYLMVIDDTGIIVEFWENSVSGKTLWFDFSRAATHLMDKLIFQFVFTHFINLVMATNQKGYDSERI